MPRPQREQYVARASRERRHVEEGRGRGKLVSAPQKAQERPNRHLKISLP